MKKRMKLLTILLAGVVAFGSTPASGLVFAETDGAQVVDEGGDGEEETVAKPDISKADDTVATMSYTIKEKENRGHAELGQYTYEAAPGTNGWAVSDSNFEAEANVYNENVDDDTCVVGTTYTGNSVEFEIGVMDGDTELVAGTDYEVTYQKLTVSADHGYEGLLVMGTETVKAEDIKNAGYYRIMIQGIGKYKGTKMIPFFVDSQDFDATYGNDSDEKFEVNIPVSTLSYTGEKLTPGVNVLDKENDNNMVDPAEYTLRYSSDDGENWTDEIKDVGTYQVKAVAVAGGNYAGEIVCNKTIAVTARMTSLQVVPYVDYTGTYTGHVIVNMDGKNLTEETDYTVTWQRNGTAVNVNALQAGETYTITVTGVEEQGYSESVTKTYTIGANADNLAVGYALGIGDAVYTGSLVKPEVSAIKGTTSVTSGFTAVYTGTSFSVGQTETVTIYGDGVNFVGHVGNSFNISAAAVNTLKISEIADMQYDGRVKRPDVTVTTASGQELDANEFSVSYVKLDDIKFTPTASGATERKLNTQEIAAIKAAGVEAYIRNNTNANSDAGQIALALQAAVNAASDTTITDAGTYVVKVTPSSGNIAAGSVYSFAVVNPIDISDYVISFGLDERHTDLAVAYTGTGIADVSSLLGLSVKADNSQTAENIADSAGVIEVKSADENDPCDTTGKHTLIISGTGNYAGSQTIEVEVVKQIEEDDVFVTLGGTKAGNTVTYAPAATVKYNGAKLTEGTDYTVEYYAQGTGTDVGKPTGGAFTTTTVAGSYVAVVKGLGEYYNGQTLKTFSISASQTTDIADAEISFNTADGKFSAAYNGSKIEPGVDTGITVRLGNSIVASNNFDIAYVNNVDAGTATLVVNGKENYYGSKTIDFEITKRSLNTYTSISEETVGNNLFTGAAITPDVQVIDSSGSIGTLKADSDYTLSYAAAELNANGNPVQNTDGTYKTTADVTEIKNAGTYIVTATGAGNYEGAVSIPYVVSKVDMDAITTVARDMGYTGQAVVPTLRFYTTNGVLCDISQEEYTVKIYEDIECTKETEAVELGTYYAKLTAAEDAVNFNRNSSNIVEFKIVEESEKSVDELQQELDAAKEELETVTKELEEAIEQNNTNQAKIDELTKEVSDQQAVVADLTKQIEELQNQISTPQRVTQTITVSVKKKSFKASSLKSKKGTFNIKAAAQTGLSYKTLKANNKVTVKANGKVVVKKGTTAGTYKVRVRAVAAKSDTFKKAIKNFTVTVTVK